MKNIIKKKILIFGGSGFLSSYLFETLQKKFDLFIAYNNNYIKHRKFKYFKITKINSSFIKKIIDNAKPNIIINTIAYTNVDRIDKNKNISKNLNIKLPEIISNICKKIDINIKLIHISTDQLFDGNNSVYYEKSKTNPLNTYAKQKLIAESFVKKYNNHLIIRTNFFGKSKKNNKAFDFIYGSFCKGKKLFYYNDIFYNPIYVKDLTKIIEKLININAKGTFNVSSDKRISKFDFAKMICDMFNFPQNLLYSLNYNDKKIFTEKRPKNMFISNQKLKKKLSIKKISSLNGLKQIKKEFEIKRVNLK